MSRPVLRRLHGFARERRGSAPIELAIGAGVLLSVMALCFDLYFRVKADAAGLRIAATMADYVSREPEPDGARMTALGEFLHAHELRVPADLVYVVSALRQPPDSPTPELLWSDDSIRIGDASVTGQLARACTRFGTEDPLLPAGFTMAAGEVIILAEVCARLTREGSLTSRFIVGDLFRLHALPARDHGQPPARPSSATGAGA